MTELDETIIKSTKAVKKMEENSFKIKIEDIMTVKITYTNITPKYPI